MRLYSAMYARSIRSRGGRFPLFQDHPDPIWLQLHAQARSRHRVSPFCRLLVTGVPLPERSCRFRMHPFRQESARIDPYLATGAPAKSAPMRVQPRVDGSGRRIFSVGAAPASMREALDACAGALHATFRQLDGATNVQGLMGESHNPDGLPSPRRSAGSASGRKTDDGSPGSDHLERGKRMELIRPNCDSPS